ncbi:MAG TPA: lipopolysaccharide kinase InaA family protein [Candidatus Desulfobacillus sp.]|nr:lipopolysaccharide kinase InaA family protein [Candidatus Desulfobacillus sp.]
MRDFVAPSWQAILEHNGLRDFEALWTLEAGWFEAPNRRRGGWSGVSRCELSLPGGGTRAVFLKRQENHNARSWTHPLRGAPTFLREFRRLRQYRARGIPTLEPVYFAMRREAGQARAILATEELAGFIPLDERARRWRLEGAPRSVRLACIREVAALLAQMHGHHIQHNCFFPNHVFTRLLEGGGVEARVIDLEKSRWRPLKVFCTLRDLDTLNRYSPIWSRSDRLRFLKAYLGAARLGPYGRWLWRRIGELRMQKLRRKGLAPAAARGSGGD